MWKSRSGGSRNNSENDTETSGKAAVRQPVGVFRGMRMSRKKWLFIVGGILVVALIAWGVLIAGIFRDDAETYSIDYDLGNMAVEFLKTPAKAKAGDRVEIRHKVIRDGGIHLYLDGEELERTHNDSDYVGFSFDMPDRDVKITAKPYTKAEIWGGGIEVFPLTSGVTIYDYLEGEKPDVDIDASSYLVSQDMFDKYGFGVFMTSGGFTNAATSCFLLYGGNYYFLDENTVGFEATSFAVADLNSDGKKELYFTFSWGSGMWRSQVGYFDSAGKTVTVFDYSNTEREMGFAENAGVLEVWKANVKRGFPVDAIATPIEERIGVVTFENDRFVLKTDS